MNFLLDKLQQSITLDGNHLLQYIWMIKCRFVKVLTEQS